MHYGFKHDAKTRLIDGLIIGWTEKFTIAPSCKATHSPPGLFTLIPTVK